MGDVERSDIVRYMNLADEIMILNYKRELYRLEFYQQSFYTSVVYDGINVSPQAIRVEGSVIRLYDKLDVLDEHIARVKDRLKYWDSFFYGLSSLEQEYMRAKYSHGKNLNNERVDKLALDEIEQIEEALCFQYGYKEMVVNSHTIRDGDFLGNLNRIMEAIGG